MATGDYRKISPEELGRRLELWLDLVDYCHELKIAGLMARGLSRYRAEVRERDRSFREHEKKWFSQRASLRFRMGRGKDTHVS